MEINCAKKNGPKIEASVVSNKRNLQPQDVKNHLKKKRGGRLMDKKALLLSLIKAKSEKEVTEIIKNHPILSKNENWKPYGGFRGNFSTIHNQAGKTIPSLVEKPMNCIDALLVKECKLRGIDPESSDAPQTIKGAVEKFFGIKGGDFSELTETERRKIAENIQIIAEGARKNPNIIIYDNGEGQHPDDFEDTLVSLHKDNKIKIKFVQGVYNQGGSGVLPYCGENKYQLILSRKDPRLLNGKKDLYGFTLVKLRKISTTTEYKNDWYEFCVNENGDVFTFPAIKGLDLGLYNRKFVAGTYIKLFSYDLPDPSIITLGLWRELNHYLYDSPLPVLLYEKRDYKGKTATKLMLGNRLRVMIDDRDKKEMTFPMSLNFEGIKFPTEVTVFKEDVRKDEFVDKLAVIFTYNGQVHEHLTNAFITTNARMPYLSGYLLVSLDCSNVPTDVRNGLFMASRDRMFDNSLARRLKAEIAKELHDNEALRKLNEKRRDEKIFQNPKDEEFLKNVMSKLLSTNEEISKLLGINGKIISKLSKTIKDKIKKEGPVYEQKRFPTFMKLKRIAPGNIKMLPQKGECKLVVETDVEDEFIIRPKDQGELKITFEKPHLGSGGKGGKEGFEEEPLDVNIVGPNQGQIKLRIKDKKKLPVGSTIPMNIELSSPEGSHIVTVFIRIDNPKEKSDEKEAKIPLTYALPKIIQVYKEKKHGIQCGVWDDPEYRWDGEDICRIFPSGDEKHLVDAVAINMDAEVLHNYVRKRKLTDKNIEHLKRLYQVSNYLISLIVYFQLSQRDDIEDKEEFLSYLMKGVGKIIIQVAVNEEIIKEAEQE